jgi:hypothetical protein
MYIEAAKGRVAAMCPSVNHPVSSGRLCIKGWTPPAPNDKRQPLGGDGEPWRRGGFNSFAASTIKRTEARRRRDRLAQVDQRGVLPWSSSPAAPSELQTSTAPLVLTPLIRLCWRPPAAASSR